MTQEQFDREVRELVSKEGIPEASARQRVKVNAGLGGDVYGPIGEQDPIAARETIAHRWTPIPKPSKQ